MKNKMTIQYLCNKLNQKIHRSIYLENFLLPDRNKHCKSFTAIDLIEDTQNAIDEFEKLPDKIFSNRSTLFIYGIFQAFYCQQDGIQHLYETIYDINFKNFDGFSGHLIIPDEIKQIRNVRNDIAGHPSNRSKGKKFYFIAKGPNSKYNFEYGGYEPDFKSKKVDLKLFISAQKKFILETLKIIDKEIEKKILLHKKKFDNVNISNLIPSDFNYCVGKVYLGIQNNYPLADMNFKLLQDAYENIKNEIIKRYGSLRAISEVKYQVEKLDYIFHRINNWIETNNLFQNKDAEIFINGLVDRFNELEKTLKYIDNEFNFQGPSSL